jgi:hypothetical protein
MSHFLAQQRMPQATEASLKAEVRIAKFENPFLGGTFPAFSNFFLVRSFEYLSFNSVVMVGPDRVSPHQGEYRANCYTAGFLYFAFCIKVFPVFQVFHISSFSF